MFVEDRARALEFYPGKLGFKLKKDIPLGKHRWLRIWLSWTSLAGTSSG
ncbi:VOC family protein [Stappia stellulata]|nr:VOC family protein [Stappia stellulata]